MPPYKKKINKSQAKIQHKKTASKLNATDGSDSDPDVGSLSPDNKSSDELKDSNIIANATCINDQMSSDTQHSEHEIIKEVHGRKEQSRNANNGPDSLSPKHCSKKNSFITQALQNESSDSDSDSDAESRKEILRSAEKRIIRKVSTSESDCRNKRVCDRRESSSESDSAPEDVTFEAGRKTVMEVNKQRVDSIHQETLRKKEQRKKKLEKFKKQKEEKLIRLKEQQENVDNASSSSTSKSTPKPHKIENSRTLENTNSTTVGKKTYFSSESDSAERKFSEQEDLKSHTKEHRNLKRLPANILDGLQDPVVHKKNKQVENCDTIHPGKGQSKGKDCELQWDTDYIPLDSSTVTQFGVIPLDKTRKKTVGEDAAAFRQNLLYGNKVKRAPATLNSVRQQKLKMCGMDRLVTRPMK